MTILWGSTCQVPLYQMRRRGLDILAALRVEEPDGDDDDGGSDDDGGDDDGGDDRDYGEVKEDGVMTRHNLGQDCHDAGTIVGEAGCRKAPKKSFSNHLF